MSHVELGIRVPARTAELVPEIYEADWRLRNEESR